jgi:biotin carboxylase
MGFLLSEIRGLSNQRLRTTFKPDGDKMSAAILPRRRQVLVSKQIVAAYRPKKSYASWKFARTGC